MSFYTDSVTSVATLVAARCRAAVLVVIALGAACLGVAAEPVVQTKTLQVGEACLVPTTGSNIVVATEGVIRVLPAADGRYTLAYQAGIVRHYPDDREFRQIFFKAFQCYSGCN